MCTAMLFIRPICDIVVHHFDRFLRRIACGEKPVGGGCYGTAESEFSIHALHREPPEPASDAPRLWSSSR